MKRNPIVEFPVIAIGGSAGAIEAASTLLAALPPTLSAAIVVVLHTASHSDSKLDRVIGRHSSLPVQFAEDGEPLRPGHVYLSRADLHLMIDGRVLRTTKGPKECRVRPAINVLFRSVAESCGAKAIGVILSGALDDGTAGLWAIKSRDGKAFVQNPSDALHDSMPLSAIEHVQVDGVGSVATLAKSIAEAARAIATVPAGAVSLGTESRLAAGEHVPEDAVFGLGLPSKYACPECRGVLAQIEEGNIVRFRCHTGHGYSIQTLAAQLEEDIEDSLWNAARAFEEKLMLVERFMTDEQSREGAGELRRLKDRLQTLRDLLLSNRSAGEAGSLAK